MSNPVSPARSRTDLESRLLRFINEVLPGLNRTPREWTRVETTTPLFASGLLDSLSILHLIAAVEEFTGRAVPDQMVVMKHFQTVAAMTVAFAPEQPDDSAL